MSCAKVSIASDIHSHLILTVTAGHITQYILILHSRKLRHRLLPQVMYLEGAEAGLNHGMISESLRVVCLHCIAVPSGF